MTPWRASRRTFSRGGLDGSFGARRIYSIDGATDGRPVPSWTPQDYLIRWNPEESALYAFHRTRIPTPVDRIDLATGRRETIMTWGGENRAGLVSIIDASMVDDLRTMAYCTWRYTSVLYLVEGAR